MQNTSTPPPPTTLARFMLHRNNPCTQRSLTKTADLLHPAMIPVADGKNKAKRLKNVGLRPVSGFSWKLAPQLSKATPSDTESKSPENAPTAKSSSPRMMNAIEASVKNKNIVAEAFTNLVADSVGRGGEGGRQACCQRICVHRPHPRTTTKIWSFRDDSVQVFAKRFFPNQHDFSACPEPVTTAPNTACDYENEQTRVVLSKC